MPSLPRRRFGQLVVAAASLPLLAAAAPPVSAPGDAPASPLTPAQMEQYRKGLPETQAELKTLHQFPLGYGDEPDFTFSAVGPVPAAPAEVKRG